MPTRVRPDGNQNSAGHLLWLVRTGRARTRGELQLYTGLSRSTITQRIDLLRAAGYLRASGVDESTGGRPAELLEVDNGHGTVLVADLGGNHARAAVVDLGGRALAEEHEPIKIGEGPEPVLGWVDAAFRRLLARTGQDAGRVRGIGVGVPGPVEFDAGMVTQPPIMPGWDGYPIADRLRGTWDRPVFVDNDANLMALGEQTVHYPDCPALVLVKVATGISAGVVVDGQVYRGIDGGAGDIGHIPLHDYPEARCECGLHGCLAAVASGLALAQRLTAAGTPTSSGAELIERIRSGHAEAAQLARTAGKLVGEVLATVVCLLNPAVLVIAGDLADIHFVTGVRETLYQRALPRSTRHLQVTASLLGPRSAVAGGHAMVVDRVYAPAAVDAELARTMPAPVPALR
ncbi:ROK family protein [Spirilliplanes yamanashiensis]|uniref:Sugar kinase n=1 Tax=Spirilliplanes yamanashiensis TaxID=42233 RepID=A0A8J3Y8A8_9ACTN|nr:ROK family protein [Spirilliplanes yamanashiensis]MDP9817224.1 putative NBD/HSP70 family sugar kinase [Spirilliplanes yamanashiensis]GIJ03122.1 sugar kinase [Spirilliplanes yamanashiensis]